MIVEEAVYLDHHGVKGMRWGIRRARATRAAADRANAKFLLERAKIQEKQPLGFKRARATAAAQDRANAQFLSERASLHGKKMTQEEALRRIKRGRKVAIGIISVWGAATIASSVARGLASA